MGSRYMYMYMLMYMLECWLLEYALSIQVLGATLDGNAVNRRLIKLHSPSSDLVYKVRNPYAQEERDLFFFSDPPHLVKTIRNCWQSKHRVLWVHMC